MDPMDLIFFDSELPLSPAQKFAAVFTAWMRLVIIDGGFIFTSDFCRKKPSKTLFEYPRHLPTKVGTLSTGMT